MATRNTFSGKRIAANKKAQQVVHVKGQSFIRPMPKITLKLICSFICALNRRITV